MKKFYEAPAADELFAESEELMSSALLSKDDDGVGEDLEWDLI